MKKIFGFIAVVLLFACTVKLSAVLNVSDILSAENKAIMVDLRVYVMSCSENNINEIKAEFEKRKIAANYNKCSSDDGFNDYASFSLPIAIIKDFTKPIPVENGIYFFVDDEDNVLYLRTSSDFASMLTTGSEFDSKLNISSIDFSLTNDTMSEFEIIPYLLFVDEKPILDTRVTVPSFSKVLITLPDVATKLLEQSSAEYPVFHFNRK